MIGINIFMRSIEKEKMNAIIDSNLWFDKPLMFKEIMSNFETYELNDLTNVPSGLILDIGCGTGTFLQKIKNKNTVKVGLDISTSAIKIAKKKSKDIFFVIGDAKALPFRDNCFTEIYYSGSFPNIDKGYISLLESKRIIKKTGHIKIFAHKEMLDPTILPSLLFFPYRLIKYNVFKYDKIAKYYWEYYFDIIKFSKQPHVKLEKITYLGVDYDWLFWNKFKNCKLIKKTLINLGKKSQNKKYISGSVYIDYLIFK